MFRTSNRTQYALIRTLTGQGVVGDNNPIVDGSFQRVLGHESDPGLTPV